MQQHFKINLELIFWIASVMLLAIMEPATSAHFSLCIFKIIGFEFCPGCGIGHSINYLFHGELRASFSSHPFGVIALPVILFRIYKLLPRDFSSKKIINHYAIR